MARRGTTRVRYDRLVPPDTFIHDYLRYMEQQETPYAYDFWTACWLLSVAIGRATIVNRPRAPVFLNLYTILVSESGIARKSTAVRHATTFARPLCQSNPQLIETKLTPELLEQKLHGQSVELGNCGAAISISELVTFLGREKYVEHMPTLLTDLYDCPSFRGGGGTLGTVKHGGRNLRDVFVSFLSATTPAWLLRAINPDVIEGGFTSRVLFIVATEPKRLQSWPKEHEDGELQERIAQHLVSIRARAQSIDSLELSTGALRTFDNWYRKRHLSRDAFRSSFQSREDAHVLRLAGYLAINDALWTVQHAHIVAAIKVITQVREDGAAIFEGTGSNSRIILGIDKIRDKLLAAGLNGLPQRELTRVTQPFMDAAHLNAVLAIMHELQMVQKFENIQVGRGRPSTIWRATSALAQSRALDKIIEGYAPDA